MSSDIVIRLKKAQGIGACLKGDVRHIKGLCAEAAAEISTLRMALHDANEGISAACAATELASLRDRVKELEADRGDCLQAAGFRRDADLHNPLHHEVVLEDIAGMRPAMVKARREAQQVQGDAMLWQVSAMEGHHPPLLLTVWKQRRKAESRADTAERERDVAREVLRPFAQFDHATTSIHPDTCIIVRGRIPSTLTLAHFDAARTILEEI